MKSFSSSKLNPIVVKNLEEKNILVPTEIQKQAIPTLLEHEGDFVGKAATGTGKTIAFLTPLISKIDASKGILQAVILVPTRELSEQIGNELAYLVKGIEGFKTKAIYGGVSVKSQINDLSNGVQVVVATPGTSLMAPNSFNFFFARVILAFSLSHLFPSAVFSQVIRANTSSSIFWSIAPAE